MIKVEVSIIVPVYNAELTIKECIESILKQTFSNWELILVDDGSTDVSLEICNYYMIRDPRIRVIHQKNKGVSRARNRGMETAKGKYLMFIDSDDKVGITFLEKYLWTMKKLNCDVVIGGYLKIDLENEKEDLYLPKQVGIYHNEIWEEICKKPEMFGYLWNKMFKKSIIHRFNLKLREDMYSQEDLDFCLSYFENCNIFGFIQNAEYQYFFTEGKRIPPIWNFIENQLKMDETAKKKFPLSNEAKFQIRERIYLLIYCAFYNIKNKEQYKNILFKLENIRGLRVYLKKINVKIKDEKSLIAQLFIQQRYQLIYYYFKCRKFLSGIKKKFF